MKKSFYLCALIGLFMLTACEKKQAVDQDVWNDATKLWPAQENGSSMIGFINANGEFAIAPKFTITSSFSHGYCKVSETEDYTDPYFINTKGEYVNAPKTDWYTAAFVNGYIEFKIGDKYGKMDTDFKTVIPASYYSLGKTATNGYSTFRETDSDPYGYLDKNGNVVIAANFTSAGAFANGIAVVSVKKGADYKKYGIINEKGEYLVELQEKWLENLGEGLVAFVDSNDLYGIWDRTGNVIISSTYDDIYPFTCGLAIVKKDNKYGAINTKGELVIPTNWEMLEPFREDVAWASMDDPSGYLDGDMTWSAINTKGEQLFLLEDGDVPDLFAELYDNFFDMSATYWQFHNGLACVSNYKVGGSHYVNKKGQTIYSYSWDTQTDAQAPAYIPTEEDFRKARKASMMDTEYAPLFEDIR